jgi:ATP-dependent DNA helicase DinG
LPEFAATPTTRFDTVPDVGATELLKATALALSEQGPIARQLPGFRSREGQQGLAASIGQALASRTALVAEAGTGTGKTFAYLVPLLLSGRRALVSTGTRHLQDQLHARDLPAVRAALGSGVRCAVLKGRANYVCHHHLARQMSDGRFSDPAAPGKLRTIHRFAQVSQTGDRAECDTLAEDDPIWIQATSTRENCLGQECPEVKRCFVLRARREALVADVVVVNHHLFCADLALRDESMGELLPNVDAVIFDEAHQLPEAASEFFGESVSSRQLIDLARDLVRAGLTQAPDGADWRALADRLDRAARELRLVFEPATGPAGTGRSGRGMASAPRAQPARRLSREQLLELSTLEDTVDALSADLVSISAIVAANAGRGPELDRCGLRATELLERLQRWWGGLADMRVHGATDVPSELPADVPTEVPSDAASDSVGASVVWAETSAQHVMLRRTPLSVADAFGRHRAGPARAWVFLSATLSIGADFSHFTDALGLQDARCERWESPFDFAQQSALWIPRGLGAPTAAGFAEQLAREVWPLICANRGRAFVLCTSLRAMREMAQALRALDALQPQGIDWLVQGEAARPALLARFRSGSAAVLVGSAGFWEGVDVVGDALSLVIIDKLPFAPPDDPVIQARCESLRRAGGDPFSQVQLPQAALALKQGAGRLIRSESDRGVLVLGDERLVTRGYGRRLLASLPPFKRVATRDEAQGFLPD